MPTRTIEARAAAWPLLIVLALSVAYAPSLGAGFLNYDDPWLLVSNPVFAPTRSLGSALSLIFCDFSRETRLMLGAEYLPLRDLLGLLETRAFGMLPEAMHAVSLLLYAAAVLFLRAAMLQTLGRHWSTELALLWFALHPVHGESVAWLAGQKDVLALLFLTAALYVHARALPRARLLVPLLLAAASLSKSMSVAGIFLLVAGDLVRGRRLDRGLYAGSALALTLTMLLHLRVGALVSMVSDPAGGSRYTAFLTMGPVWLRYLASCLFPTRLSIVYDVPDVRTWSLSVSAGYGFVLGSCALSLWLWRGGPQQVSGESSLPERRGLFCYLWFCAPLLPVSQVLLPLENRMADRYLWLSVLAPCLLLSWALSWLTGRLTGRTGRALAVAAGSALTLCLGTLSFERSLLFSDSVLLFADATLKTDSSGTAPYQLGEALEEQSRDFEAERAFHEVLRRLDQRPELPLARKATNNYARLLARQGRLDEAEQVLRKSLRSFPGDAKLSSNLEKVLRGQGRASEADALRAQPEPL